MKHFRVLYHALLEKWSLLRAIRMVEVGLWAKHIHKKISIKRLKTFEIAFENFNQILIKSDI